MTSYCVQYLAGGVAEELNTVLGYFFVHDNLIEDAAHHAQERSGDFQEAGAFRILDMGGGIHFFKVLHEDGAGGAPGT